MEGNPGLWILLSAVVSTKVKTVFQIGKSNLLLCFPLTVSSLVLTSALIYLCEKGNGL